MIRSRAAKALLLALADGKRLTSHRYLDGRKVVRLYAPGEDEGTEIAWSAVEALRAAGLIASNKKFPAATYILTEQGRRHARRWGAGPIRSLTARG